MTALFTADDTLSESPSFTAHHKWAKKNNLVIDSLIARTTNSFALRGG